MNWNRIITAAVGRPKALAGIARWNPNDVAALSALLLLEDAPHPAAALVAAAELWKWRPIPFIQAALALHGAPTLAAWRDDPHALDGAFGVSKRERLTWGVAALVDALRGHPAALRAAVAVVLLYGERVDVARCLETLDVHGWAMLDADQHAALLARAPVAAHGRVWSALDDAQRAATAQQASTCSSTAALLIGRIGGDAWQATDPALRRRLIDAAARHPLWAPDAAPAWTGMTDDERARAMTAALSCDDAWHAFLFLSRLGRAGRATLTAAQRAEIETRALKYDAWQVRLLHVADAGWTAAADEDRSAVLKAANRSAEDIIALLRVVGVAGWESLSDAERARLAAAVRSRWGDLFACPPALWLDLAVQDLPPATSLSWRAMGEWRAEDVDADLSRLPAAHQTLVLALAPWRRDAAAPDADRLQRFRAAWNALPEDERVVLAAAHPFVLAFAVAAGIDAAAETVARVVAATGGADAKRAVAAMLRTPARWRSWMIAFAPTNVDAPEVWTAWRRAARRGAIPDPAICAILAEKESAARRPCRRG